MNLARNQIKGIVATVKETLRIFRLLIELKAFTLPAGATVVSRSGMAQSVPPADVFREVVFFLPSDLSCLSLPM